MQALAGRQLDDGTAFEERLEDIHADTAKQIRGRGDTRGVRRKIGVFVNAKRSFHSSSCSLVDVMPAVCAPIITGV
ncbi:MAG: hypothetical protein Fur0039_04720 [Rhodocyclaceae bacterium]